MVVSIPKIPMATRPTSLRALLADELPRLYAFAYDMCGDREDAYNALNEWIDALGGSAAAILGAPRPAEAAFGSFARAIEKAMGRRAEQSFMILDNVLRTELTKPVDITAEGIDGDTSRIHYMFWELKRTCLTAVMGCLPPGVRLSFILTDMLGYQPLEAAELLEIQESAYRVRLTRARKRIEDFLTPRCYHVDRGNPCNCESRLGIAMDAKFVRPPPHDLDTPPPSEPYDHEPPRRDMGALYRSLPRTALAPDKAAALLARVPE